MTIIVPKSNIKIIKKDGTPEFNFSQFMLDVSRLSPIIGEGSPEGNVQAAQWQTYIDQNGTTGSFRYIKQYDDINGDATKGWILE